MNCIRLISMSAISIFALSVPNISAADIFKNTAYGRAYGVDKYNIFGFGSGVDLIGVGASASFTINDAAGIKVGGVMGPTFASAIYNTSTSATTLPLIPTLTIGSVTLDVTDFFAGLTNVESSTYVSKQGTIESYQQSLYGYANFGSDFIVQRRISFLFDAIGTDIVGSITPFQTLDPAYRFQRLGLVSYESRVVDKSTNKLLDNTYLGFTIHAINQRVTGPVPEPATWALMISGFGLSGAMLRRRAHSTI